MATTIFSKMSLIDRIYTRRKGKKSKLKSDEMFTDCFDFRGHFEKTIQKGKECGYTVVWPEIRLTNKQLNLLVFHILSGKASRKSDCLPRTEDISCYYQDVFELGLEVIATRTNFENK